MTIQLKIIIFLLIILAFANCGSSNRIRGKNKPYEYGSAPNNYQSVIDEYEDYHQFIGCKPGETIASIGAGNGRKEIQISCFIDGITWYLEEIDSSRLYQFDKVLTHHEGLKGSPINGKFKLVLGTASSTTLPKGIFDRVIMLNVFHEISSRASIMSEVQRLLRPNGELVIMERMANKPDQIHGDCKHPKLYEPEFLKEMHDYGFKSTHRQIGEEMSALTFYTFKSIIN